MVERTYVVTMDASDPTLDLEALKAFVKASRDFSSWWNHIPFVFLVATTHNAERVSEILKPFTKDAKLLVMEVNPAESQGWLSERSWNWIKRRANRRGLAGITA